MTPNLAERLAHERKISLRHLLAQAGGPDLTAVFGPAGQTLISVVRRPRRAGRRAGPSAARGRASSRRSRSGCCWRWPTTPPSPSRTRASTAACGSRLEARERLTAILEATTDLVAIADLSRAPAIPQRRGPSPARPRGRTALIGHPIAGLAPERLRPVVHDQIWPALIRDGLWTGEAVLLARDGREVPVSVVAVAHRGADGSIEFLSAIVRDMTERKRIDAELRRQREALYQTEKLATMGTVLAGVAARAGTIR